MKIKCINKNRDRNGNIISYTLQDESGRIFEADGKQIKKEMKSKNYDFVNLQINRAGRLVDKAVHNEITDNLKNAVYREFEKAYRALMNGKDVEFGFIDRGDKFFTLSCEHKVDKVIEKDAKLIELYMSTILSSFRNYICNKGLIPYELRITSNDGVVKVVVFNIKPQAEFSLSSDKKGSNDDFVARYLDSRDYYYNSKNYNIVAFKLDNPNQMLNTYVGENMSIIRINNQIKLSKNPVANNNMREQEEHKMTSREFLITLFSSFRNWFK